MIVNLIQQLRAQDRADRKVEQQTGTIREDPPAISIVLGVLAVLTAFAWLLAAAVPVG